MEQQVAISEKLNPNRAPREPFGIKARSTLNRITLTPSEASPNETLYIVYIYIIYMRLTIMLYYP